VPVFSALHGAASLRRLFCRKIHFQTRSHGHWIKKYSFRAKQQAQLCEKHRITRGKVASANPNLTDEIKITVYYHSLYY